MMETDDDSTSLSSVSSMQKQHKQQSPVKKLVPTSSKVTFDTASKRSSTLSLASSTTSAFTRMNRIREIIQSSRGQESINNPSLQKEILELTDKIYFHDFAPSENIHTSNDAVASSSSYNDFTGTVDYEIRTLSPENFQKVYLRSLVGNMQLQYEIMGRKVSEIIMQNRQQYTQELQRVNNLLASLEDSCQICSHARRSLQRADTIGVTQSLTLMQSQLKKMRLVELLKSVQAIKSLQNTNMQIKELIDAKDFPKAIELCFECQKAMKTYEHFKCINDLKARLRDRLEQIEEHLDACTAASCLDYDALLYARVVHAYRLVNKLEPFVDQLNMHIVAAVNHVALRTMQRFLMANVDKKMLNADDLKKKEYKELCHLVTEQHYKPCLVDMCGQMWHVMSNYFQMFLWHQKNVDADIELADKVRKKFAHGFNILWQDVQQKLNALLRTMSFEHVKFDEFLELLTINNRMIEIGRAFCEITAESVNQDCCQILTEATRDQTLAYFRAYHAMRLEELKMFLENEIWQWCPITSKFSIYKLQEFKFIKKMAKARSQQQLQQLTERNNNTSSMSFIMELLQVKNAQELLGLTKQHPHTSDINSSGSDTLSSTQKRQRRRRAAAKKSRRQNGFYSESSTNDEEDEEVESAIEDDEEETDNDEEEEDEDDDEFSSDDSEVLPTAEQQQLSNDKTTRLGSTTSSIKSTSVTSIPMVTNTTLNVIRLYGKYIQMLSIFRIIAHDVVDLLMQLFYFYFYFIFMHFASGELDFMNDDVILHEVLRNIKHELFVQSKYKISEPQVAPLRSPKNRQDYIECLSDRIVSGESLLFLAQQLQSLFPLIKDLMPATPKNLDMLETHANILKHMPKWRTAVYFYIARVGVDYTQLSESIARINWDVSDIMSQHNGYVDVLLRQVNELMRDVESLRERFPVDKQTVNGVLEPCLRLVMRRLVDGYGSVKKCSNEGRALMQLDFQQLVVKLEKLCDIRPLPEREYVENYIKAYYLPDSSVEKWIREHPEYSQKNVSNLLSVMGQLTRKTRFSILSAFEGSQLLKINSIDK